MRNALAHAPAKQRTAVAAMLKTIFAQESKAEAEAQWDTVADALREKQDKLGTFMDASRIRHCRSELSSSRHRSERRWRRRDKAHRSRRHGAPPVLASNCPPDSLPLRGPARTPARALDPDRVDKPAGTGEPRDQAAHRRCRRSAGKQRPTLFSCPPHSPTTRPSSFRGLTRPHRGHGPPPPSGRSCSRPTTNGPSRADT